MFTKSICITFLSLGSSLIGFFVQILLAQRFGLGIELDAYLFSLSAPVFIAGTVSAMMSYSLIPRIVEYDQDRNYQRKYIGSVLIGVTVIAFVLMGILSKALSNLQISGLPVNSNIRYYQGLDTLMFVSYLIGAFQIVQGCIIAIINSIKKNVLASILSLFPFLGMLLFIVILGNFIGIISVPLGMLFGIIVCNIYGIFILSSRLLPLPSWNSLLWYELGKLIHSAPFAAIAMSCFSSYVIVDAYWAPQVGVGTLATMGYAQRLIIGFGSLVVAGPSAVLVPRMADFVRDNNYDSFRQFLIRALVIIGSISTLVALLLSIFAEPLIQLLFARGEFGHDQVILLASTIKHMLPGMVAMLISIITLRALFCFHKMDRIAAILSVLWTIAYFSSSYFFYHKGAVGLATGYSLAWLAFSISINAIIFINLSKKIKINTTDIKSL